MVKYLNLAFVCTLLPVLSVFCASGVSAERIGTANEIRNEVTGQARKTERRIHRGDGVLRNELIKTGALSRAELRFLDDTKLTIGARSTVRLDAFVYDSNNHSGKIVINTLKGAFRFVSGSAVKSAYRIKTPLATIGVRGTVIDGYVGGAASFAVFILQKGGMEVCSGAMCQNVNNARDFVIVRENGQITPPKRWPGQLRNFRFQTPFPVGRGRFYINPQNFEMNGGDLGGEGGSSGGGETNPY